MEIELKYVVPGSDVADALWENRMYEDAEETDSREEQNFNAKYFDTENLDLAENEIAYRVRHEGERLVAALKWKGHSEDGLHVREEINVPVESDEPDPSVFGESSIGAEVMQFIEGKELKCLMETRVCRRSFRIDTGTGLFELSIDKGEIITEYGNASIDEFEVELYSGQTEELLEIGRKFQEEYGLEEENESKYCRGLKIIKNSI